MAGDSLPEEEPDDLNVDFVEVDPTGRYGRYKEVLGKGAFKTVYKAFDELEGIEVAWNQVKVADLLRNADDLDRLYSEVHLLKTLKHKNIIKFYSSWLDSNNDNINFITEVFTSGTLRQYRKKHKHVDIRALKKWSKQILSGLLYLHSHDPPVIHRDLKCDNIFVNGNHGEVKIGDLGLAAILRHAQSAHSVIGTPEFMAPELYEEEYNELVDIYAFGMCLLELVTFEYPYVECSNAAQIYKKVTSGIKPASLAKVKDAEVKSFIEKCIANVSERLSARELLMDPFLQDADDNIGYYLRPTLSHPDCDADNVGCSSANTSCEYGKESAAQGLDLTVEGQRKDLNTIFLKLRIADSTGQMRNIHFPFDTEADTSVSVAKEMVAELDLSDEDITTIAAIIDAEIQAYIPDWVPFCSHGNDVTVSDSCGHDSEAKNEVSALPSELDYPSGNLCLERLPSGRKYWCDSPKGTCVNSPSNASYDLVSHGIEDISGFINERKDDSFNTNSQQEFHSNDSSSPEQQIFPPHLCNGGSNKIEISSSPISSSFRISSSSNGLNQHHEKSGTSTGSNLCICRANFEQHEGNDRHICDPSLVPETEHMQSIAQELEYLLIEQQNELDVIQKKHNDAIAEILRELPPEQHGLVLNICRSMADTKK